VTDKLIIEVRANEYTMRGDNPHVPWTQNEIVDDAIACREAGASSFHFHPRTESGQPDLSYEANRAIVDKIRSSSDILLHPTLGAFAQDADPQVRIGNIVRLARDGLAPDFAPMDTGSSNADLLTSGEDGFATDSAVYDNPTGTLRVFADTLRQLGVKPYLHLWNLVYLRTAVTFHRLSWLDGPLWAGFCLSGDDAPIHHPATKAGLEAYLANVPDGIPIVWSVNAFHANLLALAPSIIERGGHIAVGIGDHHYAESGTPTNAELVRRVVEIAQAMGREAATPAEAKGILGMDRPS
jgi:3-keto-5-aminohexanoate cleavage enzyme